jgi:hypothetical protein
VAHPAELAEESGQPIGALQSHRAATSHAARKSSLNSSTASATCTSIVQPIEVICVKESDEESYRASAPHIGLITAATGETVLEALEKLGELIVAEAEFLEEDRTVVGYAAHVKSMLGKFVQRLSSEERQTPANG